MGIRDQFRLPFLGARDERGQAMVEYALILAFVAILAVAALAGIGTDVASLLTKVANGFP